MQTIILALLLSTLSTKIWAQNTSPEAETIYKFKELLLSDYTNAEGELIGREVSMYLSSACAEKVKNFYQSGKSFNLQSVRSAAVTFSNLDINQIWNNSQYLYHYTHRKEIDDSEYKYLLNDLKISKNPYEYIFHQLRTLSYDEGVFSINYGYEYQEFEDQNIVLNQAGGVLYAANNPYTASSFGDTQVAFKIAQNARVLNISSSTQGLQQMPFYKDILAFLKKYDFTPDCYAEYLIFFVFEDSGIDLIYYTDNENDYKSIASSYVLAIPGLPSAFEKQPWRALGWFQILDPDIIEDHDTIELKHLGANVEEINEAFKKARREKEILIK
jgi:hypothetical protein